jgi:hypothetical protein
MEDTIEENDTLTNELENLDSTNEEEKDTLEENTDESASEENSGKKEKTLFAQKEHYRTKVEKLEAKLKELQPKAEQAQKQEGSTYDPLEIVKLAQAVKDFSTEELEFVTKVAKSSDPKDIIATVNDEWVKRAISSQREELAESNKVPNPSSPSGISDSKDLLKLAKDKSITDEEIDKKTRELFEKNRKKQEAAGI